MDLTCSQAESNAKKSIFILTEYCDLYYANVKTAAIECKVDLDKTGIKL